METKPIVLLVFLQTALFISASSQDTIFLHSGKEINCLVKEIGTREIKYANENFSEALLFTVDRKAVRMIAFSDGKIWENDLPPVSPEKLETESEDLYHIQKRNAWKMDFLSLASNTLTLTYERALETGNSIEFSLGYIGVGTANKEDNASGALFKGGYKLIKSFGFFTRDMRYAHILKGQYLKFEFGFANYGFNDIYGWNEHERLNLSKWAVMTVLGQQWVFSDSFIFDFFSGIGIGRLTMDDWEEDYPYGFFISDNSFPIALSIGIRLGILTN
jgi:hypothetical protein